MIDSLPNFYKGTTMFPNITKDIHKQQVSTAMDIVSRTVQNTIRQNSNNEINLSERIYSSKNTTLRKEDIYRSLEKAYQHASTFK